MVVRHETNEMDYIQRHRTMLRRLYDLNNLHEYMVHLFEQWSEA